MTDSLSVGVVGVGNMGRHHTRVYNQIPSVDLVGIADVDHDRASEIAAQYDTRAMARDELFDVADAVSIVVPTRHHATVAREAIETGTHVLVEKPFVTDVDVGRQLLAEADRRGLTVGVGHVERYNPAVLALRDVLPEVEPFALAARRQGPPVDRDSQESVVFDLMIHDIDIVQSLTRAPVTEVSASAVPDRDHVVAEITFEDGLLATLTASRVTERRIRDLAITAADCQIEVDYLDQSVQIHRHSLPEYVAQNGDVRYRQESVIERPTVETGEPLKNELDAFLEAIREGTHPPTSGEDGLRAVELAARIDAAIDGEPERPEVLNQ
jgi:predicted dehydrogenase